MAPTLMELSAQGRRETIRQQKYNYKFCEGNEQDQ